MGLIENPEKEVWDKTIQNFDINIMDTYEYGEISEKTGRGILRLVIPDRGFLQAKIAENLGIIRKAVIGGMGGGCLFYSGNDSKNQLLSALTSYIKKMKIPECIIYSTKEQKLAGFEESDVYTIILDINKPIESLWTNLDKKHRNAVRRGEENKIEICIAKEQEELMDYYILLKETAKRAKFGYEKFAFFQAA